MKLSPVARARIWPADMAHADGMARIALRNNGSILARAITARELAGRDCLQRRRGGVVEAPIICGYPSGCGARR